MSPFDLTEKQQRFFNQMSHAFKEAWVYWELVHPNMGCVVPFADEIGLYMAGGEL